MTIRRLSIHKSLELTLNFDYLIIKKITENKTPEINLVFSNLSAMIIDFLINKKGLLTSPGTSPHIKALEYLPLTMQYINVARVLK